MFGMQIEKQKKNRKSFSSSKSQNGYETADICEGCENNQIGSIR